MIVLVDAREAGPRLVTAAAGLALRGHRVAWRGAVPSFEGAVPPTLERVPPGAALARLRADVVVAGGGPHGAGLTMRMAGAHGIVLDLTGADPARWGRLDQMAWGILPVVALAPADAAGTLRTAMPPGESAGLGAWSDAAPPSAPDAAHDDVEVLERACERVLARRRGPGRAAVFVDRDGTLVVERGYLSDPDDLELLPHTVAGLAALKGAGLPIVVISNQSGVGRGYFPLARVYQAMARLRALLRAHGIELDAVYFCPHRPDEGCACRKPGTLLLQHAASDLGIALPRSFVVGDKQLDVATAHAARARGVLVRTGYGREEERGAGSGPDAGVRAPDAVCDDLAQAADWILEQAGV